MFFVDFWISENCKQKNLSLGQTYLFGVIWVELCVSVNSKASVKVLQIQALSFNVELDPELFDFITRYRFVYKYE